MSTRIYKVNTPDGFRLVEAPSRNAAINFVVGKLVTAEPITASELAAHIRSGREVELVPTVKVKDEGLELAAGEAEAPQEGGVPAFVRNAEESEAA